MRPPSTSSCRIAWDLAMLPLLLLVNVVIAALSVESVEILINAHRPDANLTFASLTSMPFAARQRMPVRPTEGLRDRDSSSSSSSSARSRNYKMGAVLASNSSIQYFRRVIDAMEPLPTNVHFTAATADMDPNPIITAQSVCEQIIASRVYGVIVGDSTASPSSGGDVSTSAVSYTAGFYSIPVIGISHRESSLSNKNLHGSFMRTISPYSHQADVWVQLLKYLDFRCAVFIHSIDSDGLALLGRFQNLADLNGVGLEAFIEYAPGMSPFELELETVKSESHCRVYLAAVGRSQAERIFQVAADLNMTGEGYVWIVSEQAALAYNRPEGIIAARLNRSTEEAHLTDALAVVALAFNKMYREATNVDPIREPPRDCNEAKEKWTSGGRFYQHLRNVSLARGMTGRVAFDEHGDRIFSDYEIVNYARRPAGIEALQVVGHYRFSWEEDRMSMSLNEHLVVWPGRVRHRPAYQIVPRHLRVVTIQEKPFITIMDRKPSVLSRESDRIAQNLPTVDPLSHCKPHQTVCLKEIDGSDLVERNCCEGYCIDLLRKLAEVANFTYDLYLVTDGMYGVKEFGHNETYAWNGLVGDIISKKADMVVAPLTNTPERAEVMDFSKPFKYHGITILQRRAPSRATLDSFLQPFELPLWGLVMLAVHVVAFALWVLDKLSPFAKFRPPNADAASGAPGDVIEPALNLSSAIYFAWGILLNSGIGERVPKSFAGRVLGMVWAGFAMIVVASYTANLAAWLVIDQRDDHTLQGFDDRRLRNPVESFRFATVKGSNVDNYFRHQVQYLNVHRNMEEHNVLETEAGIEAVRSGKLHAFIWDSPRLEYEAAKDCTLVTLGELIARSGYGVGLQKNSYWTSSITLAVLGLHESGYMESLDNKWILLGADECAEKNAALATKTLGLRNMAGVFILVFAGIFTGMGLIVIEIIYKKARQRRIRRNAVVRRCAALWRAEVERRKLLGCGRTGLHPLAKGYLPPPSRHSITAINCSSKGRSKSKSPVRKLSQPGAGASCPPPGKGHFDRRKHRSLYPEARASHLHNLPLGDRRLSASRYTAQLASQAEAAQQVRAMTMSRMGAIPPPLQVGYPLTLHTVPRAATSSTSQHYPYLAQFYTGRAYTPTVGVDIIPPPPPPPSIRANTARLQTSTTPSRHKEDETMLFGAGRQRQNARMKQPQREFPM